MTVTRQIDVRMDEGLAKATLVLPEAQRSGMPGLLLFMDIFGLRPALTAMAERYAAEGYAVLVPDLFHRHPDKGTFDAGIGFKDPEQGARLKAMLSATSQAMTAADTTYFLTALADAGATGPVGVVGYCMGGGRAITAAGTYPERIVAAASFHGGHLATEAEDSPHRLASSIRARIHIGTASSDGSFPPDQASRLVETFHRTGIDFALESYAGVNHGWCIDDHSAYDRAGAERHWQRVTTFFRETLL
ncbi:dienelactone hydrolase family protein [Ciceribacter sp. L1K23]|uniref:dienelactone hydrolase family protein n=1 Tax=Ciceribacter sp. L1K23 TaxID=2820276 RepID=UPI001B82B6F3|nr:dienelactone hydrolase family protein [Ciceribacter sp. L1K23]MBR0555146.1 dienelactone hydrolase family protein [Ciceribacter sp. L1K23]